jgi:hypothetical protein
MNHVSVLNLPPGEIGFVFMKYIETKLNLIWLNKLNLYLNPSLHLLLLFSLILRGKKEASIWFYLLFIFLICIFLCIFF